jgi:hypothetical protein
LVLPSSFDTLPIAPNIHAPRTSALGLKFNPPKVMVTLRSFGIRQIFDDNLLYFVRPRKTTYYFVSDVDKDVPIKDIRTINFLEYREITMTLLEEIFNEFCNRLDGKLRWTPSKTKFTKAVLNFFSNLSNERENINGEREYLRLDYVWHSTTESNNLILAVEHENKRNNERFLAEEVKHLIDVKAINKIAIYYPNLGEAKDLVNEIQHKIKNSMKLTVSENYLIIFGYMTRKRSKGRSKRAILFKAHYMNQDGEIIKEDERVVFQGPKTFTLTISAQTPNGRPLKVPFRISPVRNKST